jgi:hypothetical protein
MMTWKQIERQWQAGDYSKLLGELTNGRPEASPRMQLSLGRALPAAAMAVIRMDELSQSYLPICAKMTRTVLASQDSDGGWGDPMTTAICLRALLVGNGHGVAIERGMQYLANLQKDEGIWPRIPLRRMEADAYASAFILFHLGDVEAFRKSVHFDSAVAWFTQHGGELDADTHKLWQRATVKCQGAKQRAFVWS